MKFTFGTNFMGVFALLLHLHISFSEPGDKTTPTVHENNTNSRHNPSRSVIRKIKDRTINFHFFYIPEATNHHNRNGV